MTKKERIWHITGLTTGYRSLRGDNRCQLIFANISGGILRLKGTESTIVLSGTKHLLNGARRNQLPDVQIMRIGVMPNESNA